MLVEEAPGVLLAVAVLVALDADPEQHVEQQHRSGRAAKIVIHLAPVLPGEGVRLYGAPGASRQVDLGGRVTDLRFSVPK